MEELIKMMQQEINTEQQQQRVKTLTPGLQKAIRIITDYQQATNHAAYEYELKPGVWFDVRDKQQLITLEEHGFIIRRKHEKH